MMPKTKRSTHTVSASSQRYETKTETELAMKPWPVNI